MEATRPRKLWCAPRDYILYHAGRPQCQGRGSYPLHQSDGVLLFMHYSGHWSHKHASLVYCDFLS